MSNYMNQHRYQLERYRGRGSRYVCPKCRHKHSFTRYIDTYNNIYINDSVGKCNRLDKCGYHYTPRQYFDDNPHLHNTDTYLHPWTPVTNIGKMTKCPVSNPHLFTPMDGRSFTWAKRPSVHIQPSPQRTNFMLEVVNINLSQRTDFLLEWCRCVASQKKIPSG